MPEFTCKVHGCSEAAKVGGMCVKHACEEAKKNKENLVNAKCQVCGNHLSINGVCRSCAIKARKERKKMKSTDIKPPEAKEPPAEDIENGSVTFRTVVEGIRPPIKVLLPKSSYAIEVDFTEFPAMHERLIKMAKDELRTPGMQLLYMLRNELAIMEEIREQAEKESL